MVNPIRHEYLLNSFGDIGHPEQKIKYLKSKGKLKSLMRGWYIQENDELISKYYTANVIYGPSYVSSISALSYYGLIMDRPRTVRSSVFKRNKELHTTIGTFFYDSLPKEIFHFGIVPINISENVTCLIASPTKALYDYLVTTPNINITSKEDLITFLEDDLRFELDALFDFDLELLESMNQTISLKNRLIKILISLIISFKNDRRMVSSI